MFDLWWTMVFIHVVIYMIIFIFPKKKQAGRCIYIYIYVFLMLHMFLHTKTYMYIYIHINTVYIIIFWSHPLSPCASNIFHYSPLKSALNTDLGYVQLNHKPHVSGMGRIARILEAVPAVPTPKKNRETTTRNMQQTELTPNHGYFSVRHLQE